MERDADDTSKGQPGGGEPLWVRASLYLLPVPIFAFLAAATFLVAACFFFIGASMDRSPVLWAVGGLLASTSALIGAASLSRTLRRGQTAPALSRYESAEGKPTAAIFALLISFYSWLLEWGLHTFSFFAVKGVAEWKYHVTLGIAIASSLYVVVHGRSLVRRNFGPQGGRGIVVTPAQTAYLVMFVVGCGCYFAWLIIS